MVIPPEVLLLYRIVLAILGVFFCFVFPYEVEYCSFEVFGEFCCALRLICRLLLVRLPFLLFLILPTQEYGRSFHFLVSFSISFFEDLKFLPNKSFTCLVGVTLRYFMLFVAIVKDVVSLTSFPALLSSVYRKATDFLS